MKALRAKLLSALFAAAGLGLACTAFVAPSAALAADEDAALGQGYLNPFPPGDTYPLVLLGDTFAEGLVYGLAQALSGEPRVHVPKKHRNLEALMRNDFETQMKDLEEALGKEPAQIGVVMVGASDRVSWRMPNGKRAAVGSDEWKAEYGRRVDRLMRTLKGRGVATYWVGLPSLKRSDANDDAQMMNDVIRERAVVNGVRYIDSFQALADEQGGYSDFGPDLTGKVRRLRESDGVNFTGAGNEKLAHFVEKQLKRDLAQAKQDRNIPLAGSEPEQAKINAAAKANEAARAAEVIAGAVAPLANSQGIEIRPAASGGAASAISDLKANPSRIALKSISDGKEEVLTIEIARPALPASVIAAVTRKESAEKLSQMGESVFDQIAGGVTVISSITPATEAGAARRRLSPTQSPYFRVLVKGERLSPKSGRIDEMVWPRPEPPAFVAEAPKSSKPAPSAPAAAPAASEPDTDKAAKKGRRSNRG